MDLAKYTAWLIGVILAVSANIISNLGLNFQKKAHSRREANKQLLNAKKNCKDDEEYEISLDELGPNNVEKEKKENEKQGSYVCDGVWLLGLFLQILGALLDFAALGYAPQSVVAPLGSLTLVINVCVAPCMHNEKPSFKTILATTIIIFGAATTVISSPREDGVDSVSQVFELYENTSFLMYAILTGSFITIGWCLTQYYVYLSRNKQRRYKQKYYKQHRFVIAAISGTMGAQNVLFAKSVSVLVIKSIQNGGKILFAYWETYLLLAGLFSTIYFQLRWLNSGLKRFSALYVAPIFQAFWITFSVLGGLIVYKEFDDMLISQKIVFPIGVIITIFGVFYLTTQGNSSSTSNSNNDEAILEKHIIDNITIEKGDKSQMNIHNKQIPININNKSLLLSSDDDEIIHEKEEEKDKNKNKNKNKNNEKQEIEEIQDEKKKKQEDDQDEDENGLMGLIKNLGELGEASIVTGSSLGKLLLDPNGVYKDINLGSNEEDIHYKGILSPQLSQLSDISEDISSSSIIPQTNIDIIHIKQEEEELIKNKNRKKQKNKIKQKRKKKHNNKIRSYSVTLATTEHYSDNAHERYNNDNRHKRRKKKIKKRRSRSHSPEPPLTTSEMAPHEIVWNKIKTTLFINDNNKKQDTNDYCLENTPTPEPKESIAYQNNQIIDLENDFVINQSLSRSLQ